MSSVVLGDLLNSLTRKQGNEKMTLEEGQFFVDWKNHTVRSFVLEGSIATSLTWFATKKLNFFKRLALTGGAGFLTVAWRFRTSIDACVDHVLDMEGSRLQHDLTKIILSRYGNDPEKMKLFSKHFYCEEVFNDVTPGHPVPIYRSRRLYGDNQPTFDDINSQESVKKGVYHQERKNDFNIKLKSGGAASMQVPMNPSLIALGYGDPLDVLFGHSSASEEFPHPDESGKSAKSQTHSQRKARRKHRARHRHQQSLSTEATLHQGA